ncbi:hypothetical protein H0H92_009516 [Tricholoma furcatifolium]|nr:hypothetical protein H0H92_009516 [Tricholoma furcatifolium]
MTEYLKLGTMYGELWAETRSALLEIAEQALEQNVDEIDLRFFNNKRTYRGIKGKSMIQAIFNNVQPSGYTPTGATIFSVLDEHISRLDKAVNTVEYSTIKPLDIIMLTDGVPTDRPKDVLVEAVARMRAAKHHPNAMGVQIVQIGNDPDTIPVLKQLMDGDIGSMVGIAPFNGKLTPQRLERILLGRQQKYASSIVSLSSPPNVNPEYNHQLDGPRPTSMAEYLRTYHIFFVIDDSGSMKGERWAETRNALLEIAEQALEQNVDEIDLRFFNNQGIYRGIKGKSVIEAIFNVVKPSGYTPTGAALFSVLDEHISRLDKAVNTTEYSTIKPLNIIVLTDGVPTDKPQDVLVEAIARMRAAKHDPNAVGVQIIQIGNDREATPALKQLMSGDIARGAYSTEAGKNSTGRSAPQ